MEKEGMAGRMSGLLCRVWCHHDLDQYKRWTMAGWTVAPMFDGFTVPTRQSFLIMSSCYFKKNKNKEMWVHLETLPI